MISTRIFILLGSLLACRAFSVVPKRAGFRPHSLMLKMEYSFVSPNFHGLPSSLHISEEGLSNLAASLSSITPESAIGPGAAILGGALGIVKLTSYWKMQYMTASLVGGVPEGSSLVEIDAIDGKNVFYLPKGIDFTAVMSTGNDADMKKQKEKARINEQLILECIGKANRGGLQLRGKVRTKTQEVPGKSMDCVLSVGALSRAGDSAVELASEAFRILRPGGLFLFVEPDSNDAMLDTITKIFPKTITSDISAGDKARKAQAKRDEDVSTDNSKNKKKGSRKGKKGFSSAATENVQVFAADEQDETIDESNGTISSSENKDDVAASTTTTTSSSPPAASAAVAGDVAAAADPKGPKTRPGITFERVSNGLDPFVLGIAVRP